MKRLIILIIALLSGMIYAQTDSLQEYPSARKIKPVVYSKILKQINEFTYSYKVLNMSEAEQEIWKFYIEAKVDSFNIIAPTGWYSRKLNKLNLIAASWASLDSMKDIFPGTRKDNFVIKSKGLPGIVNFFAIGYIDAQFDEGTEFKKSTTGIFNNSVKGYTIGPSTPPSPFLPLSFLDTLTSYKHQAVRLDWLIDKKEEKKDEDDEEKEDGIVAKLDKRLVKAKTALMKGDSVKAREEVEKFVKKVVKLYKESQNHEEEKEEKKLVMSNEAYALLKFNAEYLIERLQKKRGK